MTQANQADFFGETAQGGFDQGIEGSAPALTPEQIAADRARKKAWYANQGLDENGNPLPAYGTSQGQGGTATEWQNISQPTVGTGTQQIATQRLDANGAPVVGETMYDSTYHTTGAGGPGPASSTTGTIVPGVNLADPSTFPGAGGTGSSKGSLLTAQTAEGTRQLREGIAADETAAVDGVQVAMQDAANANPLQNRELTQTAANQAKSALGPAPTIDQGLTDRNLPAVSRAVTQAGQVVSKTLAPIDQTGVNQAIDSQRAVLDEMLNGPNTAQRIGSQVLRNQLAMARSAGGGAGAVQQAFQNAQFAAPELEAQAAQQATQERMQQVQAAGQQTGQIAQTELGKTGAETARLDVGAKAAGASASAALGSREQDIQVAKANHDAGMNLSNQISTLTGQQLQLNQQNTELLGNMATDLAKQQFDWSKLDVTAQDAEFERWIKAYGIDVAAAAQIKAAAANNDKGVMDYLMPIIGGAAQLGMAAL